MVHVKNLFIAASFLLSGIAAAPSSFDGRSVAAADKRELIVPGLRRSHDISDAPPPGTGFQAQKREPIVPGLKPPHQEGPDAPPHHGPANGDKDGQRKAPLKSTPKKGKELPKCFLKQQKRSLLHRRYLERGYDGQNVQENEYVLSSRADGNPARQSATNLSGCTVLFFYDADMRPSTFHILCGNERADAEEAARKAWRAGKDVKGVKIVASNSNYLREAKAGIHAAGTGVEIQGEKYYPVEWENRAENRPAGNKIRLTTVPRTYDHIEDNIPGCSRQSQGW